MSRKTSKAPHVITLTGELSIYSAAQIRAQIFKGCEAWPEQVQIDVADVDSLDTAGAQILLMIHQYQKSRRGSACLVKVNNVVAQVWQLLGLTDNFDPAVRL